MTNWKLHLLNDHFFACERLRDGHFLVYTFGERCEPKYMTECLGEQDAKTWANTMGLKRCTK